MSFFGGASLRERLIHRFVGLTVDLSGFVSFFLGGQGGGTSAVGLFCRGGGCTNTDLDGILLLRLP